MRPILFGGNGKIELNALFIQPSRLCAGNCKSCYVKEHFKSEEQAEPTEIINLFDQFYNGRNGLWANQITISFDDLWRNDRDKNNMLVMFFHNINKIMDSSLVNQDRPEVHGTFSSYDMYGKYINEAKINIPSTIRNFKMLSFSRIHREELTYIEWLTKHVLTNYNHLIPEDLTSKTIDSYIEKMTEIGKVVSSIYLTIFKRPMKELSPEETVRATNRLAYDIAVINTLRKRLPENVRKKLVVDGCLQDAANYLKTGYGCSSNVSRVQVWPDGSVTGCPYAFGENKHTGKTAEDILENIREAKKEYDFKRICYLPKVYDSLTKRSKSREAQV